VSITPDLDDVIVSGRDEFEDSFDFTFDFDWIKWLSMGSLHH
jgi:hypothetical protein